MAANTQEVICSVLAMKTSDFCYRACKICEKVLPDHPSEGSSCEKCSEDLLRPAPYQHLFRILLSIATDTMVMPVMCFDRAAQVLFGCTCDEFREFTRIHPSAVREANAILEGELLGVALSEPKNKNGQHPRVTIVIPLCSEFQPVIQTLRELHGGQGGPPRP